MNVTIDRMVLEADEANGEGPYVGRDGEQIYVGFTFNPQERVWSPLDELFRRRAYIPGGDNIEAVFSLTVDQARVVLRGLQDLVGVKA